MARERTPSKRDTADLSMKIPEKAVRLDPAENQRFSLPADPQLKATDRRQLDTELDTIGPMSLALHKGQMNLSHGHSEPKNKSKGLTSREANMKESDTPGNPAERNSPRYGENLGTSVQRGHNATFEASDSLITGDLEHANDLIEEARAAGGKTPTADSQQMFSLYEATQGARADDLVKEVKSLGSGSKVIEGIVGSKISAASNRAYHGDPDGAQAALESAEASILSSEEKKKHTVEGLTGRAVSESQAGQMVSESADAQTGQISLAGAGKEQVKAAKAESTGTKPDDAKERRLDELKQILTFGPKSKVTDTAGHIEELLTGERPNKKKAA